MAIIDFQIHFPEVLFQVLYFFFLDQILQCNFYQVRFCLDMGQGQERAAWFTQGASTAYDVTFPTVLDYLKKQTGIKINSNLIREFLPYSSFLNADEVGNIENSWKFIGKKLNIDSEELKK